MLTGLRGTLIHIVLTVVARVTSWTLAQIAPHVATAGTPMLAGLGHTRVHLLFTVATGVAFWAHTVMGAVLIHTLPTCLAQLLQRHPHLGCSLPTG